ncbi:MAG: hypothetical protein F6J90_13260 [Moorea sp. SIOASIH]|uniref:hypothetical protein n=1 Tax=Moorena sp. SIOASIH TaxID=2607817 RepID=UPI0013BC21B1|nr:hypothetical protein [Moorena sp. SIOASIH]NEO37235.1 hypothetical protein [Moorena sp. SIOASIH]
MGETTAVAHGGNPQDRAASPRPRCIAYSKTPQVAWHRLLAWHRLWPLATLCERRWDLTHKLKADN